ncbi:MAG: sialidase family protein [Acidimicrobiales bacterium]
MELRPRTTQETPEAQVIPIRLLTAVADARNGGCGLRVSRDGGLSWTTTALNLLPANFQFCVQRTYGIDMAPAFAPDGTLYVAMPASSVATGHPNGPISLVVARTSDLGITHHSSVVESARSGDTYTLPDGSKAIGLEQDKLPSIAVDPANPKTVFVSWRLTIRGPNQVPVPGYSLGGPNNAIPSRTMVAVSHDGGVTWSKPIDVMDRYKPEHVFGSGAASLVTASDGTVYGFTRESPKPVGKGQPKPSARLFTFSSADGEKTWQTSVISPGVQQSDDPQAAIAPDGRIYVAYPARGASTLSNAPPNPSNVFVLSSAHGKTWSQPVDIVDPQARQADQYLPGVSVAPDGRVDVAFYDFRNDPFFGPGGLGNMNAAVAERYWDVYVTHSSDSGATWAPDTRVTEAPIYDKVGITFNNEDIRGPMGVASINPATYVAWPDTRATTAPNSDAEDAYFSRVRFVAPAHLGAATGGSKWWAWGVGGLAVGLAAGGAGLLASRRSLNRAGRRSGPRMSPPVATAT